MTFISTDDLRAADLVLEPVSPAAQVVQPGAGVCEGTLAELAREAHRSTAVIQHCLYVRLSCTQAAAIIVVVSTLTMSGHLT